MANWYRLTIKWTGEKKPTEEECKLLSEKFQDQFDYDFPDLKPEGLDDEYWRNPMLDVETVLGLLTYSGFPCEGNKVHDVDYMEYYGRNPGLENGWQCLDQLSQETIDLWNRYQKEYPDEA